MASLTVSQGLELLKGQTFSDSTIQCGGTTFAVHRNIICHKSSFFAACVSGPFQESAQETLIIREAGPVTVALMLLWIYTGQASSRMLAEVWPTLDMEEVTAESVMSYMEQYVLTYELGERLMLPDLKVYITERIMGIIKDEVLLLAYPTDTGPQSAASVATFLRYVYTHTSSNDDGLHAMITIHCIERYENWRFWKYDAVMDAIQEHEPMSWKVGLAIKLKAEMDT